MGREKLQVQCVECGRRTNHEMVQEHETSDSSEDNDIHVGESFRIIRCLGCETVSFQHQSWCSEDRDPETGNTETREILYLNRTAGRASIKGTNYLPANVLGIYDETLKAFNADAPTLAAVGLRALVESVCLDRGCVGRNLQDKIDALVTTGALSSGQADFLHIHRFLGNEAAHEITAPPPDELVAALDVLESLLKTIYELPVIAANLKARRDARVAKRTASKPVAKKTATLSTKATARARS